MQENPPKIDPDSGLPFCVFHNDRVEHFFCEAHKVFLIIFRHQDAGSVSKSVIPSLTARLLTYIMSQILKGI